MPTSATALPSASLSAYAWRVVIGEESGMIDGWDCWQAPPSLRRVFEDVRREADAVPPDFHQPGHARDGFYPYGTSVDIHEVPSLRQGLLGCISACPHIDGAADGHPPWTGLLVLRTGGHVVRLADVPDDMPWNDPPAWGDPPRAMPSPPPHCVGHRTSLWDVMAIETGRLLHWVVSPDGLPPLASDDPDEATASPYRERGMFLAAWRTFHGRPTRLQVEDSMAALRRV